ncbi:MAG: hypothetical protein HY744_08920 [Deltaproteobacteria bacterium]|nr:hypothetical protein [Deltaproteobacteria bacterium]
MDDGSVACPAVACDPGCEYQGQFYAPGESFPAGDGCNNCGCGEDGMVACTAMACEGCWDQGQHYLPGETFPAGDGCNTCSCMDYGSLECTAMACPSGCEYQGQLYAPGESFPAGDGCNTCSCAQDGTGEVLCTQMPCAGECVYLGNSYQQGETFPSVDGCNDCTCTVKGVVCTDKACPCDPDKEWWRKYVSTDPDECKLIDYGCPENTTSFENACGCGCEQDLSCPQWFDCEPPNPCDVEAIKKKCPYSGIAY